MNLYKHCVFIFLLLSTAAEASHISGGELFYEYLGPGSKPGTDKYRITVRLFRECNSTGQILNTESVVIGIFSTTTQKLSATLALKKLWVGEPPVIQNTPGVIPCLTGDGALCYQVGLFSKNIDLPRTADGYTLTWVRCCRQQITNIFNTPYPDNSQGATFITHIPGTDVLRGAFNSSPQFVVKDTVLVCADKPFKLDFSAFDTDKDSLAYTFCDAYIGGTQPDPDPAPADTMSLVPLPYRQPYSGSYPLGQNVTINAVTGIISGTAPAKPGKYVVNVCVEEYRHGVLLNIHHKDFILKIANCDFASAQLSPSYLTCDGFGLQFENQSTSSQIHSYFWDFGVPAVRADTANTPTPFFNFPDTGIYVVKLVVNRGGACGDSAITLAKIYPGFTANFGFAPRCLPDATAFTDSSTTKFGQVDSWNWNFGDTSGTSAGQNPSYIYTAPGARNVSLTVTNSKGCTDSITKQLTVPQRPVIRLQKDTGMCNLDTLKLSVSTGHSSKFTWLPNTFIINAHSSSPAVFPQITTVYSVLADDDNGCTSTDSITVNVFTLPTVATIPDTVMCSGTAITLATASTGAGDTYNWQPAAGVGDTTALSPVVNPTQSTQYTVLAKTINGCIAIDTVNVAVKIPPSVVASPDSLICLGGSARLFARASATVSYHWSPSAGLTDPLVANPVASPTATTSYQLQVVDSNICKGMDTVVITVIPKPVFALTPPNKEICRGDTLLLTASGGNVYRWRHDAGMYGDTAAAANVFPSKTTTYTVVITSNTCNITDSLQAVVNVSAPFPLSIVKSNDVDCIVAQAKLQAYGGTRYTWAPAASLSNLYIANPIATPVETTTYYVTATNGTACIEMDSVQVKIVTAAMTNGYYIASAFTPNGDGVNDCFRVKDWGGIKLIQLSVYDRWGQMVFYSASPGGCWDGTFKGRPQPSGTYVYQVWANTVCGNVYRKGTVVLIR